MSPVGSHGIGTGHGTQGNGTFVSTFVTHYTYALNRKQNYSGLPYLMIQGSFVAVFVFYLPVTQSLNENIVGILQDTYFFRSDVSKEYVQPDPDPGKDGE